MESALYFGKLRHRRFQPRRHQFTYDLFMAWLDIDRIPELMRISPFLSHNRFNWASFCDRDHFGDPRVSLRERVRQDAAAQGISLPDGPIFLLTHLRYLGYVFNPISLFYCYDADESLRVVLAEVNSTFGETHNYWLHAGNEQASGKSRRYRCPKALHVSPFMGMDLDYQFVLTPPGDGLVAHMNTLAGAESFFDATLNLHREPWDGRSLHRALLAHPWMTTKVIAAIHWEALRLWAKKVPVFTHPARLPKEILK